MLWLLAIPVVVVWFFLFTLCRAASKPEPKLPDTLSFKDSPKSIGALAGTAQRETGPAAKKRVIPRSTYHPA